MKKSLLILEDRRSFLDRLIEVIHLTDPNIEVTACADVDSAWEAVKKKKDWDIVIIDLMVPPGDLFQEADTRSGLDTGQLFAERLLDDGSLSIKKIVIHSARNKGVSQRLEGSDLVVELPKSEYNNVALAEYVERSI